jgi:carbamoyltransferase
VQGKAEFGPRSLGHRSILADPRDPGMKDKINALVKFREEFRPFAPSILHEFGNDFFEDYAYSPYMERTFKFSNKTAAPAVVHFDGSGRLQSVTKELNGRFYALISKFYQKTNVPILLNTSFNVMGRPIIHDVEDAIGVFWGSGLDVLVLGNTVIVKD